MSDVLFKNVLAYKTTVSLFEKMVAEGIINKEEYTEIDTIIAEKYSISSCSIYRSNCLIDT